ncbi:phage holin family protein [bacterium]|nr:phage holin family protein [bacterium]
MKILWKIIAVAVAVMVTAYILPGIVVESFWAAVVTAIVLSLMNILLKPLLVILTLPVTILTLGLFLLVINALMLLLVGAIVPGFGVDTFWWALIGSVIISLISSLLNPKRGDD